MSNTTRVTAALIFTYAILGLLMNSVGTVILQSIDQFGVSKTHASTLEACKDMSVVVASFLFAASLPSFGYRRAEMLVMAVIGAGAFLMPLANAFWVNQLMFVMVGLCFGIAKVATYSSIGLLKSDPAGHASLTSFIEGIFMLGILAGIWMFGWFIGADETGRDWLKVYYVIAGLSVVSLGLWWGTQLDESRVQSGDAPPIAGRTDMLRLALLPAAVAFLSSIFLYVLVEQSIGTWLPTFNNEVLHLPSAMSVQMSTIFVGALALGRLSASGLVARIGWLPLLLGCIGAMALLVLATLPTTYGLVPRPITSWLHAPLAATIFPLIGLFMAPIYPIICSVMLSTLAQERHAAMVGLIVIFSALGGTVGSFLTGFIFQAMSGQMAFFLALAPLSVLALMLWRFHDMTKKR
jgi:fucose permease